MTEEEGAPWKFGVLLDTLIKAVRRETIEAVRRETIEAVRRETIEECASLFDNWREYGNVAKRIRALTQPKGEA